MQEKINKKSQCATTADYDTITIKSTPARCKSNNHQFQSLCDGRFLWIIQKRLEFFVNIRTDKFHRLAVTYIS